MKILAGLLLALVAASHFAFMAAEMFFWTHPSVMRSFNTTPDFAAASRVLAGNLGLYNGFLGAGTLWALISGRFDLRGFFLGCILVAGLYGGLTSKTSILFVQALPDALALAASWFAARAG